MNLYIFQSFDDAGRLSVLCLNQTSFIHQGYLSTDSFRKGCFFYRATKSKGIVGSLTDPHVAPNPNIVVFE